MAHKSLNGQKVKLLAAIRRAAAKNYYQKVTQEHV